MQTNADSIQETKKNSNEVALQIKNEEHATLHKTIELQDKAEEKTIKMEDLSKNSPTNKVNHSLPSEKINAIAKYENAHGKITFLASEAEMSTPCCSCWCWCGPKKIGAMKFPSFQDKLDEIRSHPFSRIILLINPTSGSGHGKKIGQEMIKQLEQRKIPFQPITSTSVMFFLDFIETFDFDGTDLLMVCGGDGSIFMTVNALAKRQAIEKKLKEKPIKPYPLAVIPGGTGNDLCASIGYHHEEFVTYAERYLLTPKVRRIDVGRCRMLNEHGQWKTHHFCCQTGLGFAGRVNRQAKKMSYLFREKYKVAAFMQLLSAKVDIMTIIIDGETILDKGKVKFISINLVPKTGGGFRACPIAQVNDGLLDLLIIYADSFSKTLNCLQNAEKEGLHIYDKECSYYRGREIRIITHTPNNIPLDIEIDGEDFQCSEAILDIDSSLVEIIY